MAKPGPARLLPKHNSDQASFLSYLYPVKKMPLNMCQLRGFWSTRSGNRTHTTSLPLVFETSASTNSAIRAITLFLVLL